MLSVSRAGRTAGRSVARSRFARRGFEALGGKVARTAAEFHTAGDQDGLPGLAVDDFFWVSLTT